MIDLLNLEPIKISKNLRGKMMLIYSLPKIGKTTFVSQMPKTLLLEFEPGANALNNVYVQYIDKWTDFKMCLKQLKDPRLMEKFDIIGIDTGDWAYKLCEKYICSQNDIKEISELPFGKGYALCADEFANAFRELALLGYGICFVSHSTEKTFKDEKGNEYTKIVPALPTRAYDIINKMVDIIGYIHTTKNPETNEVKRYMRFRDDGRFLAGARYKYIEPYIELDYNNFEQAICNAVDAQLKADGTEGSNDENNKRYYKEQARNFEEAMKEAKELWSRLVHTEADAQKVLAIIEKTFGRKMKLSEATENQLDLLELVISELKEF